METKILKAVFGGGRYAVTNKRTRTDYGQVLEFVGVDLPDTFECIFSNSATSAGVGKKMIGSDQQVLIPDEYLATGQTIYAWVLVHDSEDDGRHMYNVKIPVDDMPDLSPEEPTPVEQSVISQAITALNASVEKTSQKALEASDSADRAEQAAEGVEAYVERAEAAQNASESARDIALESKASAQASANASAQSASQSAQIKSDVENLVDDALASADASERSANNAYTYATSAERSSVNASASESSAQGYASQAQTSANTASGKASEASTSAQTASTKATESAQSAENALTYKTDAESAKTASQTAQGLAEQARNGAVTAKEDAESARSEAQDIVDGITNKVAQIDSNTERIESLEDDRYKPYPTDTVSGSIASFPDGADGIPLKSCIVQVNPVQDLHGYDHPWPAGGGKNLLQNNHASEVINGVTFTVHDDGTVTANGTASADTDFDIKSGLSLKAGSYVFSGCPAGGSTSTYRIFATNVGSDTGSSLAFVFSKTTQTTVRINIKSGTAISNLLFKPMICLSDAQDPTTFAPYENICPISGWTGCEVQRTGKNLMPQIELVSTPTPYEPYQGETYPITFPSEAGTVYGGTLDVTSGVLTVDRAMVTKTASDFNTTSTAGQFFIDVAPYNSGTFVSWNENLSNIAINANTSVPQPNQMYIQSGFRIQLKTAYTSKDEFVSAMGDTPFEFCGKLVTPITYPLTPQEIKTLLGQNNLWANTGDTEVEYRADTKLYIEKLTQPEEYDMIADSAINSGQFFMVGNSLYRALANIASGATITVGTNAQRVSLSDALNLVNA